MHLCAPFLLTILICMLHIGLQIHEEAKKFSYQTGVKVVVAYGGATINQQVTHVTFFCVWKY